MPVSVVNCLAASLAASASICARFFLAEFEISTAVTLLSIILAITGVLIMVGNSLGPGEMTGNLAAFSMPITFAVLIIIVRKYPKVDMVPAQFTAGVFAALIGYLVAGKLSISSHDLFLGFLATKYPNWFWIYNDYHWISNYSCCCGWYFDAYRSSFWTTLGLDFYK